MHLLAGSSLPPLGFFNELFFLKKNFFAFTLNIFARYTILPLHLFSQTFEDIPCL